MSSLLSSDPDGFTSQSSSPLQGSSPPQGASPPQITYSDEVNGMSVGTNGVHQEDTPNGAVQQEHQQQEVLDGVDQQGTRYPDVFFDSEPESAPVPVPTINEDNINGDNIDEDQ